MQLFSLHVIHFNVLQAEGGTQMLFLLYVCPQQAFVG